MMTEAAPADLSAECCRCGYDLRGIGDDQPCPECGLLAQRSRRKSDELHDTRPRWLRRISMGVWTILLALLVTVMWSVAQNFVTYAVYHRFSFLRPRGWRGYLLYTVPILGYI